MTRHTLRPVGAAYTATTLHPDNRYTLRFKRNGRVHETALPGSHFLYDADHYDHFYFVRDDVSFQAFSDQSGYNADDLFPVTEFARLFVELGEFTGDFQLVDARQGLRRDSFIRLVASDLIDDLRVVLVDHVDNTSVTLPAPCHKPCDLYVPERTWMRVAMKGEDPYVTMLRGSHVFRQNETLTVVSSIDELTRVADSHGVRPSERFDYLYPMRDLELLSEHLRGFEIRHADGAPFGVTDELATMIQMPRARP